MATNEQWTKLYELSHILDAVETTRMGLLHRLDLLTKPVEKRGKGLPAEMPEIQAQHALAKIFEAEERRLTRELVKVAATFDLASFAQHRGIGLKSLARLLAAIGEPATRESPAQLWAYCGYHVLEGKGAARAKGRRANWSTVAKTRAYVMAESCLKAGGPFREVYDRAKVHYSTAVYEADVTERRARSRREKIDGEWVEVEGEIKRQARKAGDPLSKAHIHARAMRAASKSILLHLWIEARQQAGLPAEKPSGYLRIDGYETLDSRLQNAVELEGEGQPARDSHVGPALPLTMPMIAAVSRSVDASSAPR